MFFPSYSVFLSCLYYTSLFNEREKTKCRFDRYLEHFYSSVTYSIGFFFFSSFWYSCFYKMSVAFSFI